MITIKISCEAVSRRKKRFELAVEGHATDENLYSKDGDLVCAAVSIVTATALQYCKDMESTYSAFNIKEGILEKGNSHIVCNCKNKDYFSVMDTASTVIFTAYKLLARNFPEMVQVYYKDGKTFKRF